MSDAPAFPADFQRVCRTDEIPEGTGYPLDVAGEPVAIFNDGGQFHAIRNECPHQFNELHEGRIMRGEVICPLHGWRVELATGAYSIGVGLRIDSYETRVQDGDVWVCKKPRPR